MLSKSYFPILDQEEDGKFPPVLTKLLNKEYFFTISVNEENVAQKSDVYEVCDIQLDINEKIKNLTTVEEISEEPEDDQSIQVKINMFSFNN